MYHLHSSSGNSPIVFLGLVLPLCDACFACCKIELIQSCISCVDGILNLQGFSNTICSCIFAADHFKSLLLIPSSMHSLINSLYRSMYLAPLRSSPPISRLAYLGEESHLIWHAQRVLWFIHRYEFKIQISH